MILKLLSVLVFVGSMTRSVHGDDQAAAPKITEVTLIRSGDSDGIGPQDVLTLQSDGIAFYVGTKNVERVGSYWGKIPSHSFEPSFPLLTQMYESLRGQVRSTGKPTGHVTAVTCRIVRDGKTEEIDDLCPGLDPTLWAFEMAVRGVASDIQWKQAVRSDAGTVVPQRDGVRDEADPPKVELVAWGDEKAGVQTGLGFKENTKTGKHVIRFGKPITLLVKLRNTGKTVAKGSYSEGTYYDQLPKVEDESGKPITVLRPPMRRGLWRLVNYSLKPGEELTISTPEIVFVSAAPEGNVSLPTVVTKPGKYKIGYEETGTVEVEITKRP